jgi:hypothetical protein
MLFAGASQGSVRGAAPARHTQRSLSWIYRAPRQYVGSNMLRATKAWPLARFRGFSAFDTTMPCITNMVQAYFERFSAVFSLVVCSAYSSPMQKLPERAAPFLRQPPLKCKVNRRKIIKCKAAP